jgi:hypothetical protein
MFMVFPHLIARSGISLIPDGHVAVPGLPELVPQDHLRPL